jgi:hypothetical protein
MRRRDALRRKMTDRPSRARWSICSLAQRTSNLALVRGGVQKLARDPGRDVTMGHFDVWA